MRILVCIKQVPGTNDVPLHDKTYTLNREKAQMMTNPADYAAFAHAIALKQKHGAHITVMSMGHRRAEGALRELTACGADRMVLVSDPLYAGSDTLATARILCAAVEKLGGFDLILTGRRAIDGETGHVGPELSVLLGMRCATNVLSIEGFNEGRLCCVRLTEEGAHALRLTLPVLVSVCGGQSSPRPPSLAGLRRAREAALEVFTNRELGLPSERVGLRGSPTRVRAVRKAELGKRRCRRYPDIEAGMEDVLAAIAAARSPACQIVPQDSPDLPGICVVWVFVWEEDPLSAAAAGELFAEVRRMGALPIAFVVGRLPFTEPIVNMGAERILLVEFDMTPSERECAHALAELASVRRPGAILFPATIRGRSVAPQCAALLETGLTADCTGLKLTDGGLLIQTRPAFGGALLAEIVCEHARPQLASVRPGAFLPLCGQRRPAPVERLQRIAQDTCCCKADTLSHGTAPFCDAQIVVAGGKGVGSRDEFALLRRLAELVGGEVGASRAAVDAGYAAYDRQVGQTGVMLRPRLYIAFGISGAIQHIVGMQQGECIIAVNSDPKAPIFDYADIAVISPWKDAAHALIEELERRPAQSRT